MAQEQAGEPLTRSRSRSTDNNDRLEPHLLRAAENDDPDRLREIVELAREKKQLNDNFLRIGLMRSSEKGKVGATQYLLSQSAQPDGGTGNRLSPLLRAVERNHVAIVQLLLTHGANRETRDKKGRTALMTAAWENHWHILNLLLARGADVNGKDRKGRNVLHNLAADKRCNWGDEVIQLLLEQDIPIDGKEGQDLLQRSPLHWACATGKIRLAEQLLTRPRGRARVDAVDCREKTSLHIACTHDRSDIVELLLSYKADVNARSDGGWSPLHNACEKGSLTLVRILLAAGAEMNAKLLNGITPLHLAAQGGHLEVVTHLLKCVGIKRTARDSFGFTPFLRAAQKKHREVSYMLAPFNQLENLSEDALGASNGFSATIVDFGNFRNENRVKKQTIYELLYARDSQNPRKAAFNILPTEKAADFRWIHLPANNMAWVEALLTKTFIEQGANDIEGFKAMEKSFSHQHRGQQSHSQFMRPLCQSMPRASSAKEETATEELPTEQKLPAIVINGGSQANGSPRPASSRAHSKDGRPEGPKSPPQRGKENVKDEQKDKGKRTAAKSNKPPPAKAGPETPGKSHHRKRSYPLESKYSQSHASLLRKETTSTAKSNNVFIFMPYLHFETNSRRQEMQEAIKAAEQLPRPGEVKRACTYDEMLVRAHLASSTVSLHVRRTLDQSFYHNIDTESRDRDQVVYRYQLRGVDPDDTHFDPKIIMVDQLWMWILGKDLIVTAFPQRWQQPKDDPLNVLDSIIEDINSKTKDAPQSVYDLSMIITNRCSGVFNRHRIGDDEFQLLDMFESSIGNATDQETILFKQFNTASAQASSWLHQRRKPNQLSKYLESSSIISGGNDRDDQEQDFESGESMRELSFLDELLDIGHETDLLAETKDIRDELNMIAKVLEDQEQVLPDLQAAVCDIYYNEQVSQRDVKKRFEEQLKAIKTHLKDIDRMDKQAKRIYDSITDMLDLKQKHANAHEARFARDQADGTARQSQTIMVFTIVTIIFLPMSFIAAFFTINIREFPHDENGTASLPIAYVSKIMFGVGLAISIPLIMIALLYDDIGMLIHVAKRKLKHRKEKREEGGFGGNDMALHTMKMEQVYSVAKSRRSHDVGWERPGSRETAGAGSVRRPIERAQTGFRLVRVSEEMNHRERR